MREAAALLPAIEMLLGKSASAFSGCMIPVDAGEGRACEI